MRFFGCRVIVIEDEALISALLEEWLIAAGVSTVGCAASMAEAEHMLQSFRPDGVLLDLDLDGVSALPLADRLHAMHVPFLVTTGYDPEALPASLIEETLMKPYDLPQLMEAVGRMYANRPPA